MSTEKSLKHLKSKDDFLIAYVSTYFEKHLGGGQLIIYSTYCSGNWGQQKNRFPSTKRSSRNRYILVAAKFEKGTIKPVDDFAEAVIRNNVQEFYTHRRQLPTINNLLSVLKTDIMSTIH